MTPRPGTHALVAEGGRGEGGFLPQRARDRRAVEDPRHERDYDPPRFPRTAMNAAAAAATAVAHTAGASTGGA